MKFAIKEAREERKMSQEELSEKSGVSRAIISGLESGSIQNTTTKTLYRLALALDMPVGQFFLP
jgi:transcriptional regulator with XRE-family HTH domain